jgi:ubiquinone/menaquinone biosynthesis C-methylase UbiE
VYDGLSLERPVYRVGRRVAIELLGLRAGDRVVDVGCGTGLNFGLVQARVGPQGGVFGVDLSPAMLARAGARVRREGWDNVTLVQATARAAPVAALFAGADAVLFTYSLSIMEDWRLVWRAAREAAPGARVAVVDSALPTGRWAVMAPLALIACWAGGVHRERRPWRLVVEETADPVERSLRGGHVRVAVGSFPDGRGAGWSG